MSLLIGRVRPAIITDLGGFLYEVDTGKSCLKDGVTLCLFGEDMVVVVDALWTLRSKLE